MKFFNTAGPVNQPEHYKVDPLKRWKLEDILTLIEQKKYFILHAPRQTGKTSSLLALQEYLNKEAKYLAVYANFEVGQASRNNVERGMKAIVGEVMTQAYMVIGKAKDFLEEKLDYLFQSRSPDQILIEYLNFLSEESEKPLVFLIDEIDSLVGDTLISVLRQLRAGYSKRPLNFPSTVVLCGVRDIKDYRIHRANEDIITGGSAFNIKAKSLRLGNFTKEDVINLYEQHTQETGQKFTEDCFDLVMDYTDGQPWLVNALAYEVTHEMEENRDRSVTITPEQLGIAKERLILSRQTHLDQLADKLAEDRVRRVILPMLVGETTRAAEDDKDYCIDLGLIKMTSYGVDISNQIYKEVLPRELTKEHQDNFMAIFRPDWVESDGSVNVNTLLTLFKDFWNDNAGIWASNIAGYQEAAPQLVTQAFLQRVINGGGFITREYGIARKRTDLMLKWKYKLNGQIQYQKIVIELKTINAKRKYETVKQEAIIQTSEYAKICGTTEAHVLIFDRDNSQNWRADEPNELTEYEGIKLEIWKLMGCTE